MKNLLENVKQGEYKIEVGKYKIRIYDKNNNAIYFENSNGFWIKREFDGNNNEIYCEESKGYWYKREFDQNNNEIYYEDSDGYWSKREYDQNNNEIYYENSDGTIRDNRPKAVELTVADIEKLVGKKVKIVKENKK